MKKVMNIFDCILLGNQINNIKQIFWQSSHFERRREFLPGNFHFYILTDYYYQYYFIIILLIEF